MMNWLYYLLEANLYLAVFYGFYRLFLHKETFYTLNRYYLIVATIIAFALPLLQLGYLYNLIGIRSDSTSSQNIGVETNNQFDFAIKDLIKYSYIALAAVLTTRFMINLHQLLSIYINANKRRAGNIIYVELTGTETAFSFFNLLYINPKITAKNTVLKHEMVHINQFHSADIIFFELIQILSWFNPITYLIKKDIKLIHEYIADDATTRTVEKHQYAMFLIDHSFGIASSQLTNQIFNQSILKMRINMLNQERSGGRARLKLLFVLPVISGMLCASTMAFSKNYAIVDLYPKKNEAVSTVNQDTLKKAKLAAEKKATQTGKKAHKLEKYPRPIVKPDIKHQVPPPPPVEPKSKKAKHDVPPPPPVEPTKQIEIIKK